MNSIRKFAVATLIGSAMAAAHADSFQWGGTSSLNWSDVANWNVFPSSASSVPGPLDSVYFEDQLFTTGFTNVAGLVNNIVNTSTAIGSLNYTAQADYYGDSHFYTTLIPSGVTLTVGGLGTPALYSTPAAMSVGDVQFSGSWNDLDANYYATTNYSTIIGAGTLKVTDTNSLISVGEFQQATLDLAGLSNFTAKVSQIWLGVSPDLGSPDNGPVGWLMLGRTNIITTTPNLSAPGILIGAMITSQNYGGYNYLALGGTNRFNTDGLVVGGYRAGNASYLMFENPYANNTFTLRGSDGIKAASVFSIGDMAANWASYNTIPQDSDDSSAGVVDFSGGVVDMLINNLYIGSSGTASASSYTSGTGTLIAERGTITATNVYLGRKVVSANDSAASGTLILRSNVVMNVVKDFSLYNRTNGDYYSGNSLLVVSNTALLNVGGNIIWTNSFAYDPAANVIALGGGTIKMTGGGRVTTPNLLGFGSISNASSITVTNALSMNGDTLAGIGTFNLSSNLTIGPAVTLNFAIGASSTPSVSDHINVGGKVTFNNNPVTLLFSTAPAVGNYHLVDYSGTATGTLAFPTTGLPRGGTLTFHQPAAGWAGFTATASTPATLKWAGIAGNSDIWSATNMSPTFQNWINTSTLAPEYFYQFDNVVFGDANGVSTEVMLDGSLVPASITVTGTSSYTFSGGGKISGAPAFNINQDPASTFSFGANGGSDLTTPINVNSGTFKFTDASAMSPDGNGGVNVASGAAFDLNGYSYPYDMGQITISGTGVGGSGALYTSSGSQNNLKKLTLNADATIGLGIQDYTVGLANNYDSIIANALNLNAHTLTLTGTNAFIVQFANVGNGSIKVAPGGNLYVYNSSLTGSGTITLPAKSTLSLWGRDGYESSTMGAINKSLSVSNAVFQNNNSQSYLASSIPDYFGGTVTLNGALTLIPTYQPMLFSGVIQGSAPLILNGPNTVTLTAANTYNGPTKLSQGTLILSGSGALASTNITVNPTATFDVTGISGGYKAIAGQSLQVDGTALGSVTVRSGSTVRGGGSISGSVTLSAGGTLAVGSTSLGGTLAVGNNLTINGGTNVFKWGGPDDLVAVGGNLVITAPVVIKINPVDLLNGRHVMYTYAGSKSGVTAGNFIFQSTRPLGFVLDTSVPGEVAVTISGSSVLSWHGGTPIAPTAWDVSTTNWLKSGSPDHFLSGDSVTFDNTSVTNRVSIPADVDAGSVLFSNSSKAYTFTGTGGITAGSMKTYGGSSVTFSNTGDTMLTGSGLTLNAGTLTFAQPADTTLTAKINGSGLAKSGTNTLTLMGSDSSGFTGSFNVNGGTVKLGTAKILGSSSTTIANGATLDVNGLFSADATIYTTGAGVDGNGAINNNSDNQVDALANISFNGDTTFGASGARWDVIPGTTGFQGNNNKLTKVTANDIWIRTDSDTGLGDIDVKEGQLVFAEFGTLLGNTSSNIVVRTNAALAFANGIQDLGNKHTRLDPGARIVALGSGNQFNGSIVLSNGLFQAQYNGGNGYPQLTLGGNLSGPATFVAQGVTPDDYGSFILSGTNTYTGGTVIQDAELDFTDSHSIPVSSNIVLLSRNPYYSSGSPVLGLLTNVVSPVGVLLDMQTISTVGDPATAYLYGDGGTWTGPITITGDQDSCAAYFYAGAGGLTVAGAVDGTGFSGNTYGNGGVKIGGDSELISDASLSGTGVQFNNALQFNGSLSCDNAGFGGSPAMSKLILASGGNSWNDMNWSRGVIQIGADNALPLSPITIGTLLIGADHRVVLDLNGHNQTLANWMETFTGNDPTWMGNSSTNANSVLTYAGTGVNTWTAYIVDSFDTNAPVQKQTSLSVTAGYLQLIPFPYGDPSPDDIFGYFPSGPPPYPFGMTYTGPTTISGGTLEVDKLLGISPVTVNGTGTLSGNNGVLLGTLTVAAGGTLAPGVSPADIGTLAVSNNVALAGTCVMKVNLAASINDQLTGVSHLTYGGTLIINSIGDAQYGYTAGQIIKLFDASSYSGSFSSIVFPGVTSYDASNLTVDGTIKVVTVVSTTPAPINTVVVGGNSLQLSWPSDHIGWRLQVQTNGLNFGPDSVWYDIGGSAATNQVTMPIDRANPPVFYRMVYP